MGRRYSAVVSQPEGPSRDSDRKEGSLWTIQDVAAYFRIPPATVRKWLNTDPSFPRGVRVGKHRRWRSSEILAWEDQLRKEQG